MIVLLTLAIVPVCFAQQVGFTMTRGKAEGTYINFNNVATNIHADLNQEVGAFRCSSSGLYYFSFTGMAPRRESLKISLRKNRIPIVTLFSSEGVHSSISGSMVLWLVPNDIVYPFIEDGQLFESIAKTRSLTSFSGFKVQSSSIQSAINNNEVYAREADQGEEGEADVNDLIFTKFQSSNSTQDEVSQE